MELKIELRLTRDKETQADREEYSRGTKRVAMQAFPRSGLPLLGMSLLIWARHSAAQDWPPG